MKQTTLKFPGIQNLIHFQMVVKTDTFFVNRTQLTIRGSFHEDEIKLAVTNYAASVIDDANAARYL